MIRVSEFVAAMMVVALLAGMATAQARSLSAGKIAIIGEHPLRLYIHTSAFVAPQVQVVPNPERLVIDLPNTTAGAGFHGFAVGNGEIRGVRTSIFSTSPLVARVVVDLYSPEWYQVAPDSTGLLITLGNNPASGDKAEATIGWVSTRSHSQSVRLLQPRAVTVIAPVTAPPATGNGVNVQFAKGQLSIHATDASLSEVLYQIQKKTGAEIAIPSGTEQERVAGDFGPGTPNEVLAQLLNGSPLNFVVIGSDVDPKVLRSVILTPKGADADPPARFAQTYTPPPTAEENLPANPEPVVTPEPGQQEPIPLNGPPPEPPQD